ncbi:MAG: hypothetical protein DMF61_15585 [Blastocatellia bacterium AA13]|nr:MAG: hypothetical protein DMF61_15585 [Blastocatellia bacterium AA13]
MTETHDFDRVMRQVRRETTATRDSERRVIIDPKHGRAVETEGFWGPFREFRYFIVSNSDDASAEAFGAITITHKPTASDDNSVDIRISYKASCPPGREKQVAEVLHHGGDPGATMNALMAKWALEEAAKQNGSLFALRHDPKKLLEGALRTKALSEAGLMLEVDSAVIPRSPLCVKIVDTFSVHANDYYRDEDLTARIELARSMGFGGIPYPDAALRDLIRNSIQDYFAHEVSLGSMWKEFNTFDFNQRLIRRLKQELATTGYDVSAINLERTPKGNDEPYSWRSGIPICIGEPEGRFECEVSNLFVNLGLTFSLELKTLDRIKPLLAIGLSVPTEIRQAVIEATRQLVRSTNPAAIYDSRSPAVPDLRWEFKETLERHLETVLSNEFDATIGVLVLTAGETEVTRTLAELRREPCAFKAEIARNRRNAEACLFRGYFRIDGVDRNRWEQFRRTLPPISTVRQRLEAAIGTALENDPIALIDLNHTLKLDKVRAIVWEVGPIVLLEDFGLIVAIEDLSSDDVESEKKIAESIISGRTEVLVKELNRYFEITKRITDQIKRLEEDVVMIKAEGGQSDAINELNERIKALRQYLPSEPLICPLHYEQIRGNGASRTAGP